VLVGELDSEFFRQLRHGRVCRGRVPELRERQQPDIEEGFVAGDRLFDDFAHPVHAQTDVVPCFRHREVDLARRRIKAIGHSHLQGFEVVLA